MQEQVSQERPWRVTVNGKPVHFWRFATKEPAERQAEYHRRGNAANPFADATYGVVRGRCLTRRPAIAVAPFRGVEPNRQPCFVGKE